MPSARPPAGPPAKNSHARDSRFEIPRGLAGSEWGSGDFPALFFRAGRLAAEVGQACACRESVSAPGGSLKDGPYCAKVSRPTDSSSQVLSATGVKLGPILVGEVVPSSARKCPMVSRPAGDLFSLLVKKDPHHRRERNFCPAGDPFPTGQVLTAPPRLARGKGPRNLATHRSAGAHCDFLPQHNPYSILPAISRSAEPEFPRPCKQLGKFSAPRRGGPRRSACGSPDSSP
jgi:hypothetical protein